MNERKTHWETVYRTRKADEVSWYQPRPETSLALIGRGVTAGDGAIDVGGGASRLIDHLLDAGFNRPAVLDISGEALAIAQQRLGPRASQADWYEADVTEFRGERRFDLWHDRAVFHFLTDPSDRRRYRETLTHHLQPGGCVIIAAFAPDGPDMCSGLEVVRYDAQGIAEEFSEVLLLEESVSELHRTPAGNPQHFNFFRFSLRIR